MSFGKRDYTTTKLKTLHVMKFFMENTDEEHPAHSQDVIKYLNSLGFRAERKAIYTDVDILKKFGLNIVKCNKGFYYKAE